MPAITTSLAPIVLFVYNRPVHTKRTIDALRSNELAEHSDIYIYSDAAKGIASEASVQEVRDYLKLVDGFNSVTIFEREKNFGLANSIIDGVSSLCDKFGRVIVLEDDLVTSRYFLRFMNDALNYYSDDERVISIHGYMPPVAEQLPATFFLRGADCWGWATWARGWSLFESDATKLLANIRREKLGHGFNYDGHYDYVRMLQMQVQGKIDSWAIRWHASAFLKNKLTLYPGKSYVLNIGNDSSGTHCSTTDIFSGEIADVPVKVGDIQIRESVVGRSAMRDFFRDHKIPLTQRIAGKVKRICAKFMKVFSTSQKNLESIK